MNREEKMHPGMDAGQFTNFKSLLSFPCSTCTSEKTKINTVSILSCQFAKPKWWKHLRKFRMRLGLHDCSELEWLQHSLCPDWVGVPHWHSLNLKVRNEEHAFGFHNLDRPVGTMLWASQWLLILSKEIYNDRTLTMWKPVKFIRRTFELSDKGQLWRSCFERTKSWINMYLASAFASGRLSFSQEEKKISAALSSSPGSLWSFAEISSFFVFLKLIALLSWSMSLLGLVKRVHISNFLSSWICTGNPKQYCHWWWCIRREHVNPSFVDKERCDRISKYGVIRKIWEYWKI